MILLNGSSLKIDELVAIVTRGETVAVAAEGGALCPRSSSGPERMAWSDALVYGINTGVGSFAEVKISCDRVSRRLTTTIRWRPTSPRSPNRSQRSSSKTRVVL